ncbi:MAG TPA: DUF5074 domain-containing protein [Bacteroidales bacterium]|nr:DUF5074 domain-containing protein [Bacteroidales bacterium]
MSTSSDKLRKLLLLPTFILLLIFGSCTNDLIENVEVISDNSVVTLTAVIGGNEPGTRLSMEREDAKLKAYWTSNDKVWVYCEQIGEGGTRNLIPVENNPVAITPNLDNPTSGTFTFAIPPTLKGSSFNVVGCCDPFYTGQNQPQLTDDGSVVFNIEKSGFYRIDQDNVRIPMYFKQTISADGTVAVPTQFKNMGSLIFVTLKNATDNDVSGKFTWTTSAGTPFYYTGKGLKVNCKDGVEEIVDGHFSENAVIDFDYSAISQETPVYTVPSKETIELAAWFAPVEGAKIGDITVQLETEEGSKRSGKLTLSPEISPRVGKAYSVYGNITGWKIIINKERCLNVTDLDGTFVVCEGNMTSTNGMLVYYDKNGTEYLNAFKNANNGLEIGNSVQDMYMANGKVYLLTQNGDNMGGAGRFVVCDAKTMKMEYADPLIIKTPEGKATWPQHLVVTSDKYAYVQYAEVMEHTSGIVQLELGDKKVTVKNSVEGTFGKFTVDGTTKIRMVYSRGKLFAGNGQHLVIIDPERGEVEKKLTFEGQQVKGVVKGADGNIYLALAGKFDASQSGWGPTTFTSPAQIVGVNHEGEIILTQDCPEKITFPIASWSPTVNMCASFTEPHLYFADSQDFAVTTLSRFNYETKEFDVNYIKFDGWDSIYGVMGVHPTTKKLWVSRSTNGYTTGDIYVFDVSAATPVMEKNYHYSTSMGASPAGVDFAYRFSEKWINK